MPDSETAYFSNVELELDVSVLVKDLRICGGSCTRAYLTVPVGEETLSEDGLRTEWRSMMGSWLVLVGMPMKAGVLSLSLSLALALATCT